MYFAGSKILLTEKLPTGNLVTPTPVGMMSYRSVKEALWGLNNISQPFHLTCSLHSPAIATIS